MCIFDTSDATTCDSLLGYAVMAYIVMACILLACCIVMAYIVMAYKGMLYISMPCKVMAYIDAVRTRPARLCIFDTSDATTCDSLLGDAVMAYVVMAK